MVGFIYQSTCATGPAAAVGLSSHVVVTGLCAPPMDDSGGSNITTTTTNTTTSIVICGLGVRCASKYFILEIATAFIQ